MFNEFNKIYTFMTIAKERSFSKASKVLNISQPAVTLQIKKLEDMIGSQVIIRKKNGILLTKEGEEFYKLCQKFEHNLRLFKSEIDGLKNQKSKFVITTTSLIQETIVPFILEKVKDEFNLDVDVKIQNNDLLLDPLRDKRCDICIVNNKLYGDNIEFREFFEYEFIFISNKKMDKELKISDIPNLPLIKDVSKKYMYSLFQNQSLRYEDLKTIYEFDSTFAIISTLLNTKNDQLFAFMPEYIVKSYLDNNLLFKVDIKDLNIKRLLYVAALKENAQVLDKFLKIKIS